MYPPLFFCTFMIAMNNDFSQVYYHTQRHTHRHTYTCPVLLSHCPFRSRGPREGKPSAHYTQLCTGGRNSRFYRLHIDTFSGQPAGQGKKLPCSMCAKMMLGGLQSFWSWIDWKWMEWHHQAAMPSTTCTHTLGIASMHGPRHSTLRRIYIPP